MECDGQEELQCAGEALPIIEVTSNELLFWALPSGMDEEYVRIRNTGLAPLNMEEIAVTMGEEYYSISFFEELSEDGELPDYEEDTAIAPDVVDAGEKLYIRVRFTPEHDQETLGNLRIESDDPDQQAVDIELAGNLDVPCLDVIEGADGSMNFGTGSIYSTNHQIVTVRNCSSKLAVTVEEIEITDDGGGAFSIEADNLPGDLPAAPESLSPNEVRHILVSFAPMEDGEEYTGELYIESTDTAVPEQHVSLSGTGVDSNCPVAEVTGTVEQSPPDNPVIATNQDVVELSAADSYDPDGGSLTYQWSVIERPAGSQAEVLPSAVEQPQFEVDIVGDFVIELEVFDETGLKNCDPAMVEIISAPMEDIHIQLTWESPSVEAAGGVDIQDERGTDLDIHYVRPGGSWGDSEDAIFWDAPAQYWNGDGTVNVTLDIDDSWGAGPENVNHSDPEIGNHEVGVHFYRDYCWAPANAKVRIYFGETLIEEKTGLLEQTDNFWYVGTIDWQGTPQNSSVNILNQFTETHSLPSYLDTDGAESC